MCSVTLVETAARSSFSVNAYVIPEPFYGYRAVSTDTAKNAAKHTDKTKVKC